MILLVIARPSSRVRFPSRTFQQTALVYQLTVECMTDSIALDDLLGLVLMLLTVSSIAQLGTRLDLKAGRVTLGMDSEG
ncbi:hypothetical protein RRG08_028359 [Elysia crispata]|uniref:Uncharacterized protein n=1 Tax=Elysia crispata TaxID=231223 RepID=A0AAE1AWP0_9GAST|nr:hypothetical protein RRG08_028359 [Elysia crispata]